MSNPTRTKWAVLLVAELALISGGVVADSVSSVAPLWVWAAVTATFVLVAVVIHKWSTESIRRREGGVPAIESVPTLPPNLSSPRPQAPHRAFTTRTPAEMAAEYEGRTNLQAERAVIVYTGKWLRISGLVGDVYEHRDAYVVNIHRQDAISTTLSHCLIH